MTSATFQAQLTVSNVADKAQELLNENGQTTTLDIKNALRQEGFFATQDQVAQSMYLCWHSNGWHWTFNGEYRTYYPSHQDALDAYNEDPSLVVQTSWLGWIGSQPGPASLQVASQPAVSLQAASQPASEPRETRTPVKGDWFVFDYEGRRNSMYVTGIEDDNWTDARNTARLFFSKQTGIHYYDVGANVVRS